MGYDWYSFWQHPGITCHWEKVFDTWCLDYANTGWQDKPTIRLLEYGLISTAGWNIAYEHFAKLVWQVDDAIDDETLMSQCQTEDLAEEATFITLPCWAVSWHSNTSK